MAASARELLPVPYSHIVFTLPGALSPLVLQNAKLIYNLLFRCVSETLLTIARIYTVWFRPAAFPPIARPGSAAGNGSSFQARC
jgi:hypothetical protein